MSEEKYSYTCPHCNYVCRHDYEPFQNIAFKKCEECDFEGTPKQRHEANILRIADEIKKLDVEKDTQKLIELAKEMQSASAEDYMFKGE